MNASQTMTQVSAPAKRKPWWNEAVYSGFKALWHLVIMIAGLLFDISMLFHPVKSSKKPVPRVIELH